ncbi:MAG TPA: sigma-70 family RNA polymerase sigma factor [Tepidisphaeraceae bacterium]
MREIVSGVRSLTSRETFRGNRQSKVTMFRTSDTEEFIRLFTAHQVRLQTLALSLIPNYADAEEVLQQASLIIWKKFGEFDRAGGSFFAWASRILSFEAKNYYRRKGRDKLRFDEKFLDVVADRVSEMSDELAERQRLLSDCVARLRPEHQEIIRLRYGQGATVDAVARAAGRTSDAIYNVLSRIRQVLVECVDRQRAMEGRS